MLINIILFLIGFILITKGADIFINCTVEIGKKTNISEIILGATIVSFATTLPELTVSLLASLEGHTTISLGNAVGSIICNTGLILGLVSFISPFKVDKNMFFSKSILLLICVTILLLLAIDKNITKIDSILLLFMLIVYISPLFQKDYDYIGRKALMGIWSTFIFMIVLAITIWRMLIGTYSNEDATLFYCFVKAVSYFLIPVWVCFTTGKKNKIRTFFVELKSSFKTYQINILDYYMLAFLALFIFSGANNNVAPIGIFGIHEILNKKNIKGIIYIILGNLCIFLNYKTLFIGYIFYVLYT